MVKVCDISCNYGLLPPQGLLCTVCIIYRDTTLHVLETGSGLVIMINMHVLKLKFSYTIDTSWFGGHILYHIFYHKGLFRKSFCVMCIQVGFLLLASSDSKAAVSVP